MKTIQIAHPNDLRWKTVDTYNDDISSHLISPSFETSEGLLVRCMNGLVEEYCGIFSERGEWVNVSAGSDVFNKTYVGSHFEEEMDFVENKSWVQFWMQCESASWMISGASFVVSKQQTALVNIACVETVIDWLPKTRKLPKAALEIAKEWALGSKTRQEVRYFHQKCGRRSSIAAPGWVDTIVEACERVVYDISYPVTGMYDMGTVATLVSEAYALKHEVDGDNASDYADKEKSLANLVRATIPFYDIAIGLAKL